MSGPSIAAQFLGQTIGALADVVQFVPHPGARLASTQLKILGNYVEFNSNILSDGASDFAIARSVASVAGGVLTGLAVPFIIPATAGLGATLLAGGLLAYIGSEVAGYIFDGISFAISYFFDNVPITPLIIDLDGDGQIELTPLTDTNISFFDLDGDGFAEQTGWVQPDDGLLAIDRNGDGIINDITEVFGNATTDGFIELHAKVANDNTSATEGRRFFTVAA